MSTEKIKQVLLEGISELSTKIPATKAVPRKTFLASVPLEDNVYWEQVIRKHPVLRRFSYAETFQENSCTKHFLGAKAHTHCG